MHQRCYTGNIFTIFLSELLLWTFIHLLIDSRNIIQNRIIYLFIYFFSNFTMIPYPNSYGTVKSINQSIILIIQDYLNVLQENIILVYTISHVIQCVTYCNK